MDSYIVTLNDLDIEVRVVQIDYEELIAQGSIPAQVTLTGGVPGPPGIAELVLSFPIELYVGPGVQRLPIIKDRRIVRILLMVGKDFPPLGADLIFDVLKNDVSITVTSKPTVLDGETKGASIVPDDTELLSGDDVTVDILQVGSIQPGSYATLVLEVV